MQSITTKYHGPTNTLGSRVSATNSSGNRIYIPWDTARSADHNHKLAARIMCNRLDWHGQLAMSEGAKNTRVFVWITHQDVITV